MGGGGGRYCVVTPYFKEDRAMLQRCMDSVRRQTTKVDHMLVADGFPQDWISTEPVRHLILSTGRMPIKAMSPAVLAR